jgi:hypothetical protein
MSDVRSASTDADIVRVSVLVVKPWARYGHDRLYVQTADGTRLGYLDNKTGATVLDDEAHREAFDAALAAHRGDAAAPAPAPQPVPVATSTPAAIPAQPRPVEAASPAAVEPVPAPEATRLPAAASVAPQPVAAALEDASPPAVEDPQPVAEASTEPEWTDLAATRAGAAAREQALALKQAAPVKTFLARALGVKTDERAWRIGADAEEEVAARLKKLGERWKVLHAVPVGENGSDIDHVVIGPGGVFTINTKHHPDAAIWVGGNTFMVDGHRVPYVRNSRYEAQRTARMLTAALGGVPVFTTGLIAVMGARKGFTIKSQPDDGAVVVMTRREVAKWLAKRPDVLTDEQVEAIYAVARRSDTWREPAPEKRLRRGSRRA